VYVNTSLTIDAITGAITGGVTGGTF